jgi:hypothetical protein
MFCIILELRDVLNNTGHKEKIIKIIIESVKETKWKLGGLYFTEGVSFVWRAGVERLMLLKKTDRGSQSEKKNLWAFRQNDFVTKKTIAGANVYRSSPRTGRLQHGPTATF